MTRMHFTLPKSYCALLCIAALLTFPKGVEASNVMYITPMVSGSFLCDEYAQSSAIPFDEAVRDCASRGKNWNTPLSQLLNTLEPGGPAGNVQVGYTLILPLLSLYIRKGDGWVINDVEVDNMLRLIGQVKRPVVVYFLADHFNSEGPLPATLEKDPENLMHFPQGETPQLGYFGNKIIPYTLETDPSIPVNQYRYQALKKIASKIQKLPKADQNLIIAFTLTGELHHFFPDFANGTGNFDELKTTDYSARSVRGFHHWLKLKYSHIDNFNYFNRFSFARFEDIPAPSKDIRKTTLNHFAESYDSYADGQLPIAGWLWDPEKKIDHLDLYINGQYQARIPRGFNRQDVYRADEKYTDPNVGFRINYDFRLSTPAKYNAQVVAVDKLGKRYQLGERTFVVVGRDQKPFKNQANPVLELPSIDKLDGVKYWLDMPRNLQDVYYNPLARDWNEYRQQQPLKFLTHFYQLALDAGLPADKIYSHQILPSINSSWNTQLFAAEQTVKPDLPWKTGINFYGGAANSDYVSRFIKDNKLHQFAVPEFHPQQWKTPGVALQSLKRQQKDGAFFVSPYFFSMVPRFFGGDLTSVTKMEISPTNTQEGSDQLYQAIIDIAKE